MAASPTATPRPQRGRVANFFAAVFDDLGAALEAQIVSAPRRARAAAVALLATLVTWWVYVPVHELLHALGCYATGGTVSELQIAPEYGGALFAQVFPFVTAGGDYAGRLSGFDTHGSDLVYLATDALPFVLTIMLGVPLLKASARGVRPALVGAGFVLALAPFYSVLGDYYEMGSILTTRALTIARGGGPVAFAAVRGDDVTRLVSDLWTRPAELTVHTTSDLALALVLVGVSLVVGIVLACATYALGERFARVV